MAQLWRRHTGEMESVRNPGLRLLPTMLGGVVVVAAVGYFGLKPGPARTAPDLDVRVEGQRLRLPDGTLCPLVHRGCDAALSSLPVGRLRITAPPTAVFATVAPALTLAAHRRAAAWLHVGADRVEVESYLPAALEAWSDLHGRNTHLRLRVILRADGIWIGSAAGKVLGADPRGPTLLPTPQGPDFVGLERKLRGVELAVSSDEEACGLLPTLDTPTGDVLRAAKVIRRSFKHVVLAVP